MKNTIALIYIFLTVFAQHVPLSSALQCYLCEEQAGKICDQNVRSVLKTNCTESFVCVKYIWSDNVGTIIHRSCSPRSICDDQRAQINPATNRTLKYCSTCNTTLCNSAPISSFYIHNAFIASFFVCLFMNRLFG
ncbi:unnamed protein product [Phyllotreta striolata]|uniref:Protein sleepless n=1 Tax=Phyllotreta striolata TaxID=444603 RepID=A0A9N9XX57_PHYSR|nr:unnamed protein product [Phyllotreta striolata]